MSAPSRRRSRASHVGPHLCRLPPSDAPSPLPFPAPSGSVGPAAALDGFRGSRSPEVPMIRHRPRAVAADAPLLALAVFVLSARTTLAGNGASFTTIGDLPGQPLDSISFAISDDGTAA